MHYGKIENYKITATCRTETETCTEEIPDEAVLFDFLIDGTLYPATEYGGKIPAVTKKGVTWSDDPEIKKAEIKKQIAIIDSQIAEIEAKTYRPLREIQLGIDSGGAALEKLNEYNMQIEELRTKRAKL